jgi:hypothetical protein
MTRSVKAMTDTDRLAALLIEVFPAANRNQWPFTAMDVAASLIAAGVTLAPAPLGQSVRPPCRHQPCRMRDGHLGPCEWTTDDKHDYEWCRRCLLVRQANGSSDAKPCRGPAKVRLRTPDTVWRPDELAAMHPATPAPLDREREAYEAGRLAGYEEGLAATPAPLDVMDCDCTPGFPHKAQSATPVDPEGLRENLLAAKAANENVLRLLRYWRLDAGHPGIFAREVDTALDAAMSGTAYQPIDEPHGAQVGWTRDRLRAALKETPDGN